MPAWNASKRRIFTTLTGSQVTPAHKAETARIGIIGFGVIGSSLYREILSHPEWGLEVAFVHSRSFRGEKPDASVILANLGDAEARNPDLVVEAATTDVTVRYGSHFLGFCDYMPLSLCALADPDLYSRLLAQAQAHGTRLYIPHGAAVGLNSIFECHDLWECVKIVMTKNPRNLDFSCAPMFHPEQITEKQTLYDGPTRELCRLFPRNVNAHAATAIAGIGFDRTRSVLIADPLAEVSTIEIEALAGSTTLHIQRTNPLTGVSGVLTMRSIIGCVRREKSPGANLRLC
jgi:aspartate dehydrogenase